LNHPSPNFIAIPVSWAPKFLLCPDRMGDLELAF